MGEQRKEFPFEIRNLDSEAAFEKRKHHPEDFNYVRIGPTGYMMPGKYKQLAADMYNMPLRTSDVFILTFPRSGTTWTSELIWLLANDLDYDKAASEPLVKRFPFVELSVLIAPELEKSLATASFNSRQKELLDFFLNFGPQEAASLPSPRFIKSHLPLSLLPPSLLEISKVVYVARNPKDVAVSFFNLNKLMMGFEFIGDFKDYWNLFIKDLEIWCPYWDHLKEAWNNRHHPNMLFLFYEDLMKDLSAVVRRMASFLDKPVPTEQQMEVLLEHLSITNFKTNNSVNDTSYKDVGLFTEWHQTFIRKGKVGGWRDHFDDEMAAQAQSWIEANLRDTDLRFPE